MIVMSTTPEVRIYTIGHSTRALDVFVQLLQHYSIRTLADIRSYPGSRKFPHFGQEALSAELGERGIQYVWLKELGGRRKPIGTGPSPNEGWRHPAFRNYADYMATAAFASGIEALLELASQSTTAMMCAEAVYWRCHRRLVSDYLVAHGVEVLHIMDTQHIRSHQLTEGAVITADRQITYPAEMAAPLWNKSDAD
jgi:uncharacterized protein (DUF488 family)